MNDSVSRQLQELVQQSEQATGGLISVDTLTLTQIQSALRGLEAKVLGHDIVIHNKDTLAKTLENQVYHHKQAEVLLRRTVDKLKEAAANKAEPVTAQDVKTGIKDGVELGIGWMYADNKTDVGWTKGQRESDVAVLMERATKDIGENWA
jgi:hypothetical protein